MDFSNRIKREGFRPTYSESENGLPVFSREQETDSYTLLEVLDICYETKADLLNQRLAEGWTWLPDDGKWQHPKLGVHPTGTMLTTDAEWKAKNFPEWMDVLVDRIVTAINNTHYEKQPQ